MEIKVEVIEAGNRRQEDITCPQCERSNPIEVEKSRTEGRRRCWYCNALLKWTVIEQ